MGGTGNLQPPFLLRARDLQGNSEDVEQKQKNRNDGKDVYKRQHLVLALAINLCQVFHSQNLHIGILLSLFTPDVYKRQKQQCHSPAGKSKLLLQLEHLYPDPAPVSYTHLHLLWLTQEEINHSSR